MFGAHRTHSVKQMSNEIHSLMKRVLAEMLRRAEPVAVTSQLRRGMRPVGESGAREAAHAAATAEPGGLATAVGLQAR
jgi:hypothetical protein